MSILESAGGEGLYQFGFARAVAPDSVQSREASGAAEAAVCYREVDASEARAVIGWLARELGCATLSDVGKLVNRDVGSISSSVRRLSYRMQDDAELADRVRILKDAFEETT